MDDMNIPPEQRIIRAVNVHKSDITEIETHVRDHLRGQIDAATAASRIRHRLDVARESLDRLQAAADAILGKPSQEFRECDAAE